MLQADKQRSHSTQAIKMDETVFHFGSKVSSKAKAEGDEALG